MPEEPAIGSELLCPCWDMEHLGGQLPTLFPPKQTQLMRTKTTGVNKIHNKQKYSGDPLYNHMML